MVSVDIRLGQTLYLHATSVGKLFAAHIPQLQKQLFARPRQKLTQHTLTAESALEKEFDWIRKTGYAVSREEAIPGIVGIAVPVYDAENALVAALHVSTLSAQMSDTSERELVTAAISAAASIERELGRLHAGTSAKHRIATGER